MADHAALVGAAVDDVLGGSSRLDEEIRAYVVGVLEDEHYDHGDAGAETYEHLGPLLVESGVCADDAAAREACRQLAARLDAAAAAAAAAGSARGLTGGPVLLADAGGGRALLTAADKLRSGRDLIQSNLGALPEVSERDRAKLERLKAKEEAAARAAFEAHQRDAAAALSGGRPTLVRNLGGGGSRDVRLENFSVGNGGRELIVDATVTLAHGRRLGLVGRNGSGKTTFLRALAGGEIPGVPPTLQVLHVEQEVAGGEESVLQAVLACDAERAELLEEERALMARLGLDKRGGGAAVAAAADGVAALSLANGSKQQQPGDKAAAAASEASEEAAAAAGNQKTPAAAAAAAKAAPDADADAAASARLQRVWERLTEIDADGAEARAAAILSGLSFDAAMMAKPTRALSGGWRMRVALARALFVQPDLLLLDEPTNHLDLHAVLWLEDYLLAWPKTVLLVSHARDFLDAVCTDILHLHNRQLTSYRGNYSLFVATAAERARNAEKASEAAAAKMAHVQKFIDTFRYNAKRASLVQSRIKALERMAAEAPATVERDPQYKFSFPPPPPGLGGGAPLSFSDVEFRYGPGAPLLFLGLNFGVDLETRAAIVGPNGVGKSTLLGLIAGTLEPTGGLAQRNPNLRIATFSQHTTESLDMALNALQTMLKGYAHLNIKEHQARSHLGSFGVDATLASQPLYTLSGGQKARVALAKLTYVPPHVLLLDEPSNHLDMDAVDALIEGLALYPGGVLVVSHDAYLIEAVADELWCCEGGRVDVLHGTFAEYKQRLRRERNNKQ